jgi:hypothetical protein
VPAVLRGGNSPRHQQWGRAVVAIPEVIVEIHPAWRVLYFVYEDEIVIVDPNTYRIVAVIEA